MKKNNERSLLVVIAQQSKLQSEHIPKWLVFLAYLAYLIAMRPQKSPEIGTLRTLIVIVGLVLSIVALVVAGTPEIVKDVIAHWPVMP